MIKRRYLAVLAAILASVLVMPAVGSATTLYAIDDSYVYSGNVNGNYGTSSFMYVRGNETTDYRHSYLKFDLTGVVPPGYEIATAHLFLYHAANSVIKPEGVLHVSDDSWKESNPDGITWTNAPAAAGVMDTDTLSSGAGWVDFDLLANGDFWVAGDLADGLLSVMLQTQTEPGTAGSTAFSTKEATANHPYLIITLQAVPVPPTVLLLGSGLLGLAIIRRRKQSI